MLILMFGIWENLSKGKIDLRRLRRYVFLHHLRVPPMSSLTKRPLFYELQSQRIVRSRSLLKFTLHCFVNSLPSLIKSPKSTLVSIDHPSGGF
jgi:hypothetical protein